MDTGRWFNLQHQLSTDMLIWAYAQVPAAQAFDDCPHEGISRSAACLLESRLYSLQQVALPTIQQWLGMDRPRLPDEDAATRWLNHQSSFRPAEATARLQGLAWHTRIVLGQVSARGWLETRDTIWGCLTLLEAAHTICRQAAGDAAAMTRIAQGWQVVLLETGETVPVAVAAAPSRNRLAIKPRSTPVGSKYGFTVVKTMPSDSAVKLER